MAGERQENRWVIRPSLWFDAVCLIPLLARALSDASTWPGDLEARYLELTATRHSWVLAKPFIPASFNYPEIPLDDQQLSGHAQNFRPLPSGRAAPAVRPALRGDLPARARPVARR